MSAMFRQAAMAQAAGFGPGRAVFGIAALRGRPGYMFMETARASVDLLSAESAGRNAVHVTFFGGETLKNFPFVRDVAGYAKRQAAARNPSFLERFAQRKGPR